MLWGAVCNCRETIRNHLNTYIGLLKLLKKGEKIILVEFKVLQCCSCSWKRRQRSLKCMKILKCKKKFKINELTGFYWINVAFYKFYLLKFLFMLPMNVRFGAWVARSKSVTDRIMHFIKHLALITFYILSFLFNLHNNKLCL